MSFEACYHIALHISKNADDTSTNFEIAQGAFELWYAMQYDDYRYVAKVAKMLSEDVGDETSASYLSELLDVMAS